MKLLIVTNIPTPYRIAFFNKLNKELKSKDGSFKVLYCAKTEPGRHWIINDNDQLFDFKVLRGIHLNLKNYYLHLNINVILEIQKFKPDHILFAGSWNMLTVILALFYIKLFKNRINSIFWSEGHDGSILHKSGIIPHIRSFILNMFDSFAVPNQRSNTYLFKYLKLNQKPVIMLPNTIDGDFYSRPISWSNKDSETVMLEHGLPSNAKMCLQVSQIDDRKGVNELVLFWNKLDKKIKEGYILVFVGEGNLKNDLKKYIKIHSINDVYFLGNQPKNKVRELLFSADLFILLTKNDPNPLSLIEASYARLPILTTRFAGNHEELVKPNINGFVLENINFDQFETAFKQLSFLIKESHPGEWSFENVEKKFDITKVAIEFISQIKKS